MGERKQFALNSTPHVAEIGDTELKFKPEVMGDEYLDAYSALADQQKLLGNDGDGVVDIDKLRAANAAVREFLGDLMLEPSMRVFLRWVVVDANDEIATDEDGKEMDPFVRLAAAEQYATENSLAVRDDGVKLPDRVLVELMQWAMELYGGRPTGSSNASAANSAQAGNRSTAASRSKASTRTRGRSGG